ncbi:hypothetical protein LTR66_001348 [Elasticomyces elasticus]|nr:hypothetical protein LTR66_001348 [Elasticomyces elasticus]
MVMASVARAALFGSAIRGGRTFHTTRPCKDLFWHPPDYYRRIVEDHTMVNHPNLKGRRDGEGKGQERADKELGYEKHSVLYYICGAVRAEEGAVLKFIRSFY